MQCQDDYVDNFESIAKIVGLSIKIANNDPKITSLTIEDQDINWRVIKEYRKALRTNTHVKSLSIIEGELTKWEWFNMGDIVRLINMFQFNSLKWVFMQSCYHFSHHRCYNTDDEEGKNMFLPSPEASHSCRCYNTDRNGNLKDQETESRELAHAIATHPTLKSVNFTSPSAVGTDIHFTLIEEMRLSKKHSLTELKLMDVNVSPELQASVYALPITSLVISSNIDSEGDDKNVVRPIQTNTLLTSLKVKNLTPEQILNFLVYAPNLTSLRVGGYEYEEGGDVSGIASYMKHNRNLISVSINRPDLDQYVGEILNHNNTLTRLTLTRVRREYEVEIVSALRTNSSLTSFERHFHTMSRENLDQLSTYIKRNKDNAINRNISLYELSIPLAFKDDDDEETLSRPLVKWTDSKRQRCK